MQYTPYNTHGLCSPQNFDRYSPRGPCPQTFLYEIDTRTSHRSCRTRTSLRARTVFLGILALVSLLVNIVLTGFIAVFIKEAFFQGNNSLLSPDYQRTKTTHSVTAKTFEKKERMKSCELMKSGSVCESDKVSSDASNRVQEKNLDCWPHTEHIGYLISLMKPFTDYRNPSANRAFYFTRLDNNSLSNGPGRIPLKPTTDKKHIRQTNDKIFLSKRGSYRLFIGLTLNFPDQSDIVQRPNITISVMRETKRGEKTEIITREVNMQNSDPNTYNGIVINEIFHFDVFDKVYVLLSELDSIWKYSKTTWVGMIEV